MVEFVNEVCYYLIPLTQGHLKKRKLESGKSQPTKPKKDEMTGEGRGNGSKSVEDEVEEESKSLTSETNITVGQRTKSERKRHVFVC